MLNLIVGFALMAVVSFWFIYANDTGEYWGNPPGNVKLETPSVYWLEDRSIENINRYIDDVICPYYYFLNMAEVIKRQHFAGEEFFIILGALPGMLLFSSGMVGLRIVGNMLLSLLISALVEFVVFLIARRIYKNRFELESFHMSEDDYEKICKNSGEINNKYGECEEAKIKRKALSKYIDYLARNKQKIEERIFAKKAFSIFCGIIYLFVAWNFKY